MQQQVVKHWSRLLRDAVETKIFAKYNPKLPHLASMLALHWASGWTRVPQEVPSNPNHFTILWHYVKWRIYFKLHTQNIETFFHLCSYNYDAPIGLSTHFHTSSRSPGTLNASSQILISSLANVQMYSKFRQSTGDLHFQSGGHPNPPSIATREQH